MIPPPKGQIAAMSRTGKRARRALLVVAFAMGLTWMVWMLAIGISWLLVVFTQGQDPILEISPVPVADLKGAILDTGRALQIAKGAADEHLPGATLIEVEFASTVEDLQSGSGLLSLRYARVRRFVLWHETYLFTVNLDTELGTMELVKMEIPPPGIDSDYLGEVSTAGVGRAVELAGREISSYDLVADAVIHVRVQRDQTAVEWNEPGSAWREAQFCIAGERVTECPPDDGEPSPVRTHNAAWLGVEWVNEPNDDATIAQLADDLRARHIDTIFVYASYLREDGTFNLTYGHAASFVSEVKRSYPELSVQAWIGLPLTGSAALSGIRGYVDLTDPHTRQMIATFCSTLVADYQFDGVHLDPEPVRSEDADVLVLLEDVRSAIGPNAALSIAARRIVPAGLNRISGWLEQWAWSSAYYREIGTRVDQIAVMAYDSAIPVAPLYRWFTRGQLIATTQALGAEAVELYLGIPTSEERTLSHWPSAENMKSGLLGVTGGLDNPSSSPSTLTGVAIYPEWETDAQEWADYESLWLGR
ncbi:MAG: glycoside hydrolase family 18 protein [Anaerolineae bacterium]